jgi:hypothetical protein
MAAFVGFCVQSAGIHWPWNLQGLATFHGVKPISFAEISAAGGPGDQWDALPSAAKLQIFAAIGFLELCGESSIFLAADGQQHYVRGGKPGYFPKLKGKGLVRTLLFATYVIPTIAIVIEVLRRECAEEVSCPFPTFITRNGKPRSTKPAT